MSEPVYGKEEREACIKAMQAVAATFYRGAASTHCHPFLEWTGLINEYIKICQAASIDGVDFMSANQHTGTPLPIHDYEAAYIGEKLGCIFGPSFRDPKIFQAFLEALELPFEVEVKDPRAEFPDVQFPEKGDVWLFLPGGKEEGSYECVADHSLEDYNDPLTWAMVTSDGEPRYWQPTIPQQWRFLRKG